MPGPLAACPAPGLLRALIPGPGEHGTPPSGFQFPRILPWPRHQPRTVAPPEPHSRDNSTSWAIPQVETGPCPGHPSTPQHPKSGSHQVLSNQPPEHLLNLLIRSPPFSPARVWPSSSPAQVPAPASSLVSLPPLLPLQGVFLKR